MFEEIKYPNGKIMYSYGRNGTIKTTGIHICHTKEGIDIAPITSKKTIGVCNIGIHHTVIPELIKRLQEVLVDFEEKFPTPVTEKAGFCPECGGSDVDFGDIDGCTVNNKEGLSQHCICRVCNTEWEENFEFVDKERVC